MHIKGLIWLGTQTERFADMVQFYDEVLGLRPEEKDLDFALYRLPNGDTVELFGPGEGYDHFSTGPVAGLWVDDVPEARAEMEAKGVVFLGPTGTGSGSMWAHFKAPDGTVYELKSILSHFEMCPQLSGDQLNVLPAGEGQHPAIEAATSTL